MKMDQKTTNELSHMLNNLSSFHSLNSYVSDLPDLTGCHFADYFLSLPEVQKLSNRELITRSGIERTYYYQILNGTRQPGRDKVLLLSLAAKLTLEETQRALKLCNLGILYPRRRRDAIVTFAVNHHVSVADTQELLLNFEEQPLQ
jgi:transcriptional regulator with XRE-family HTH domain